MREFVEQYRLDGRTIVEAVQFTTRANGGGDWQIANPVIADDWIEGFVAMLRHPLVPRERVLQMNARTVYYAAKFGNVRFFERVSEVFRKRDRKKMRAAGGTAKDMVLLFWIPAGLWKLKTRQGCERLNQIANEVKSGGETDSACLIVKAAMGKIEKKAYEVAKFRLGL